MKIRTKLYDVVPNAVACVILNHTAIGGLKYTV